MAVFTGAGVAIATPFDENYNIDYESFGKFIDFQIENKTDAIIVCGTSGEASTLSHEEHIAAIRYCVNRVNKRVPVIAGTGSNCTDTASYLTKQAQNAGADAALVVTPYYNKATQNGLIAHYTDIAKHTDLPIILYNVPSRTGCKLEAATIAKLVKENGRYFLFLQKKLNPRLFNFFGVLQMRTFMPIFFYSDWAMKEVHTAFS